MNVACYARSLRIFVASIGALATTLIISAHAHAATLVVTSTASTGAGTLAQAITDANPNDTITFEPNVSGTISIIGTTFFTKSLTIQGPGAQVLTVTSGGPNGIFSLGFGASNQIIRFSGLTIRDGFAFVGGNGAAFTLFGANNTLALTDMVLANNSSAGSTSTSGAVFVTAGNMAVISATTIASNTSPQPGVAVLNQGSLMMINSTVSNNRDGFTPTNVNASSISNSGVMTLTNVTFFSNTTQINSTGVTTLTNVLLGNPGTDGNCAGIGFVSLGGNLSSDATCTAFTQPTDLNNTNPLVGPLQNNGGSTRTHALLVGSPAVGAGGAANCPVTDQRGVARPQGTACDIGAYEFVPLTQTISFGPLADRPITDPPFALTATASSGLTVTFASLTPGACIVTGATATLVTIGTCTVRATQAGDRFYQTGSNDQSFAVQALTQTITFDPLPDRPISDPPFALTATTSSGLSVTFASLTPTICTVTGNTVTLVAAGQCTIRASQPGDATYAAAADVDRTFNVQKLSQTITFAALPDRTIGDVPFALAATASSGLTVTFTSTTPAVCTVTGNTVTLVAAGMCTILASQPGDATYSAAPGVARSFAVNRQKVLLPVVLKQT